MAGLIELDTLASARFGIVAARLNDCTAPLDAVDVAAIDAGIDLLTARVEASELPRVHALEAAGFRLMDTLVVYQRSTQSWRDHDKGGAEISTRSRDASITKYAGNMQDAGHAGAARTSHLFVRRASAADLEAVSRIARAAFRDYIGHFHADPKLDKKAADAVYVEWAENNVRGYSEASPVLVACLDASSCLNRSAGSKSKGLDPPGMTAGPSFDFGAGREAGSGAAACSGFGFQPAPAVSADSESGIQNGMNPDSESGIQNCMNYNSEADPVGFLCFERNGPDAFEITLNAVHPDTQNKGVYTALLVEAIEQTRRSGAARIIISTQVNNYAVQRVWGRLGFAHFLSLYTFHKWYR